MKKFILLSYLLFAQAFAIPPEIIGGESVNNIQYPWQMSLQLRFGRHFCGGVLISRTHVLTAAHCVKGMDPSDLYIKGNSKSGALKKLRSYGKAADIFVHPKYDGKNVIAHDLAVIKLKKRVKNLEPIALSSRCTGINMESDFRAWQVPVFVTGWGMTEPPNRLPIPSGQLMRVRIAPLGSSNVDLNDNILRDYLIQKYELSESTLDYLQDLNSRTLLTEGFKEIAGACSGDSGGPVFTEYQGSTILVGIASYVAGGEKQCLGIAGSTNVQSYEAWIKEIMEL